MTTQQQPQAPFQSASLYAGDLSPDVTEVNEISLLFLLLHLISSFLSFFLLTSYF